MRRNKPLLIDLGELDTCCTNHALETLAKAISGEDGPHDIWEPHHSPFVQSIIELFTKRGLLLLTQVQKGLNLWLDGAMHQHAEHVQPPGLVQHWTPTESDLVRLYLTSLPPEKFAYSDWSLVVDYLLHTYMPEEVLHAEAEWFAVRSAIMGKVQANIEAKGLALTVPQANPIAAALPSTILGAQQAFNFGSAMDAVMAYGQARCMDQVVGLTAGARAKIKKTILEHTFQKMQGNPEATKQALQSRLFDEFADLNRDWRRIALTEAAENANQGMISALVPGSRVRRVEQYKGACSFCKKIDGVVMEVVDPSAKDKNGDTQVWTGKTNIGRSAATRKRVDGELVERVPSEMWWIAAGVQHPHCRGGWDTMPGATPGQSPQFQQWLDERLHHIRHSHTKGNAAIKS